ncbi:MAG: carboxymuconolactone decarboxylase family protein [Candidatus Competibacterales bacterium]
MGDDPTRFERGMALFRQLHPTATTQLEDLLADVAPDLLRLVGEFPFADIYPRQGLDLRSRQIATLASLATRGDGEGQLAIHIGIALEIGLSRQEIVELFVQLAPYAGFPTAINGVRIAKGVFAQGQAGRPAPP